MAKPHAISAIANGAALRMEYDSIDDVMNAWAVAAKGRVFPGAAGPVTDLALTIAGKECVRIPDDGWLMDRPEDRAA